MRIIRTAVITVYLSFALLIGYEYFSAYPITEISVKVLEILFLPFFILVCITAGKLVVSIIPSITDSMLEKYVFAFALGAGVLSLAMFFLGVLGLFNPFVIWALILTFSFLRRGDITKILLNSWKALKGYYSLPALNFFILLPVLLTLSLVAIASLAPPTYYDTLSYHYALPGLYVTLGKITGLPYNFYSHFPQNFEMLYAFAMLTGNYVTPNFVTFAAGLFTLLAVYSFSRRFIDVSAAKTAVFLFSTTTAFMLLSTGGYVEAGLALFMFMAVYSFAIYSERNSETALILSGVFCGFALGTKYTGGIVFAILAALLLIRLARKRSLNYLSDFLKFSLATFIVFLPWLIKNFINTGNPVFPFLYEHLGSKNLPFNKELAANYFSMLNEYQSAKGLFAIISEIFLFPFRMIHSPQKYGGGFDMLGDFGWMFFVISLPSVIFVRQKKSPAVRVVLFFAFSFFAIWIMTKPVLRFLYPVLPAAAVISAYSIVSFRREKDFLKYPLIAGAILFAASNLYLYFHVEKFIEPFGAAIGTETRREYLSRKLLNSPYPAYEFINENLPKTAKILLVGERRGFYCKRDYVSIEVFSAGQNPVVEWANSSKDAAGFREKLVKNGFTHVLYNYKEGERLRGYGIFNFSANGERVWQEFLSKTPGIFDFNTVYVFKLIE